MRFRFYSREWRNWRTQAQDLVPFTGRGGSNPLSRTLQHKDLRRSVVSPFSWNNTLNGAKLNMALRRWGPKETELQAGHVKEGRDFFNEEPKPEYYKPYVYPQPLQGKL